MYEIWLLSVWDMNCMRYDATPSHGPISLKIVVGSSGDFAQVPIFYEQFNHFMNSHNIGIIHKILE